jgi:hypothetical protein
LATISHHLHHVLSTFSGHPPRCCPFSVFADARGTLCFARRYTQEYEKGEAQTPSAVVDRCPDTTADMSEEFMEDPERKLYDEKHRQVDPHPSPTHSSLPIPPPHALASDTRSAVHPCPRVGPTKGGAADGKCEGVFVAYRLQATDTTPGNACDSAQKRPAIVADFMPQFPEPHTYMRTPVYFPPMTDYVEWRTKEAQLKAEQQDAVIQ